MYNFFQTIRGDLLLDAVISVYNCSRSTSNISYFEKLDAVKKLLKLNEIASGELKMYILFALAYLIDEEKNDLFCSTNGKQI